MTRFNIQYTIRRFQAQCSFRGVIALAVILAISCESILLMQHTTAQPASVRYDRVCKVTTDAAMGDMNIITDQAPAEAARLLTDNLPEIEMATRAYDPGPMDVRRQFPQGTPPLAQSPRLLAVDSNFVDMFQLEIVAGSAYRCLSNPSWVVLSETMATQLFGGAQKAVNQPVVVGKICGLITAVVKDQPENAPIVFDILLPMANMKVVERNAWNWTWIEMQTWVRVREQPAAEYLVGIEEQLPDLVETYATPGFERIDMDYHAMLARGGHFTLHLQSLSAPVAPAVASNTVMPPLSKQFTFGLLGFHLKNRLVSAGEITPNI